MHRRSKAVHGVPHDLSSRVIGNALALQSVGLVILLMSHVVAPMYTQNTVRNFLRPVAFCALLLIGGVPAAALACEVACAAPTGHPAHHDSERGSHHQHSSAVAPEPTGAIADASIVS